MPIDKLNVPIHIGIIMDGNGRWAKKRNLPRTNGHKEGLEVAKRIVKKAASLGVKYVTLYTFSTENWKRAQEEVGYLMTLIKSHLRAEFEFYKKNGIRIKHIGNLDGLPNDVKTEILDAVEETSSFTGLTVVLAINYGGRDEIVRAVKSIIKDEDSMQNVSEESIRDAFDVKELPDVDLLIRTGGELRLSNFLLWHAAYAELLFSDTLWPDFDCQEFLSILSDFNNRDRRFGDVKR